MYLSYAVKKNGFEICGINIKWYGICYAISFIIMRIFTRHASANTLCIATIFGIIGARVWFIFTNYLHNGQIAHLFHIREGGLAIQGGLILGYISTLIFLVATKQNVKKISDDIFEKYPICMFICRIGNFLNDEFMYLILNIYACLLFAFFEGIVIFYLVRRSSNKTSSFFIYYGIIRFILDFLRKEPVVLYGLKVSQFFCILSISFGILKHFYI